MSAIWTACFVGGDPTDGSDPAVVGSAGSRRRAFDKCGRGTMHRSGVGTYPPRRSHSVPNLASQMRVAFASIASNTGSSSPGELEMTLQHLRRRRLLLQGFAQIVRARLYLLEQPHVLDRDYSLSGKSAQEIEMYFGKGAGLGTRHDNGSERATIL